MQSYENLSVWKKAVALSVAIYKLSEKFPQKEVFGLTSQIRRAAVSVPSNIAEGRRRGTDADFRNFLRMAHGSLAELETQLLITKELSYCSDIEYRKINTEAVEVSKMLQGLITKLR